MLRYVFKRLIMMIFVVLGVAVLIFTIMYFMPGDPAEMILGSGATAEAIAAKRTQLGLDQPYFVQLGRFLWNALHGDLGQSYINSVSVWTELKNRLPYTLIIAVTTMILNVVIGIPLGVTAAVHKDGLADKLCMLFAMFCISVPGFWVGLVLVIIFSVNLGWLPPYGTSDWTCFIMPCMAASLVGIGNLARQSRSSMLDVIHADYVTTARAKGQVPFKVTYKHALSNALIPIITVIGNRFGASLGGTIVIENVFSIGGIGMYVTSAIANRDYPVIRGSVVFLAIAFSIIMLVVDLIYAFIDPRIKAQYVSGRGR